MDFDAWTFLTFQPVRKCFADWTSCVKLMKILSFGKRASHLILNASRSLSHVPVIELVSISVEVGNLD